MKILLALGLLVVSFMMFVHVAELLFPHLDHYGAMAVACFTLAATAALTCAKALIDPCNP